MPDYIGLGDDTSDVHPYVAYPSQNAQTGLAMVKAARSYLADAYQITARLPLFVTGYSEGGGYALQTLHMMQDNPRYASALRVRPQGAVPLSGFFDVSGTGLPYLFDNISAANNPWFSLDPQLSALSKPYLSAYLTLSFANYSGISPTAILANGFYNCPTQAMQCGPNHNLDGLFFTAPQTAGYDSTVITVAFAVASLTSWSPTNNAVTPLLTPEYAAALMQRDLTNPLYQQLVTADTYRFVPKLPVTVVSLAKDSIVTPRNSDVAFGYFTAQNPDGPYKEELVDNQSFVAPGIFNVGPIDHTTELPFMSVLLLNQFKCVEGCP